MIDIAIVVWVVATAAGVGPPVLLHTTFENPEMPPYVIGYRVEAWERHDLGPQQYARPRISAPAPAGRWLTSEGGEWVVWTDYPAPGQVIYLCIASWNSAGESDCVTQEVY